MPDSSTELDLQVYAPDGTNRNIDPDRLLPGVTWEYLEMGGMGRCSFALSDRFEGEDLHGIGEDDTVKIWVGSETHPRFVGLIGEPARQLEAVEGHSFVAFGRMEDMNRTIIRDAFPQPGGADLAVFASRVLDRYAAKRPYLVYTRDIRTVGVNLETLELSDVSARAALDKIAAQAPGALVWGWEVDPDTGYERFYFRPRVDTLGYVAPVGENVTVLSQSRSTGDIVHRVSPLKGGAAKYPNLLASVTENNAAFGKPIVNSEATGNLIPDPGFENRPGGVLYGGASYKSGGLNEGPTHTGDDMVELDQVGEGCNTTVAGAFVAGHAYTVGAYLAQGRGGANASVTYGVEWQDASHNILQTDLEVRIPESSLWERAPLTSICPPGAAHARHLVEMGDTGGSSAGVMVDDRFFYDASAIAQTGWSANTYGNAKATVDWVYDGGVTPFYGPYCVKIRTTDASDTDGQDMHLQPQGAKKFTVSPNQQVRFSVALRRAPGETTSPKLFLEVHSFNRDGSECRHFDYDDGFFGVFVTDPTKETINANALPDTWQIYSCTHTFPSDAASGEAFLTIRGNGAILVGMLCVRDEAAGIELIAGDTFEKYVDASAVCASGTPGAVAFAAAAAQGRIMEAPLTNEQIVDWSADAQAWLAAYFDRHAQATVPTQVDIHHEVSQVISPGSGLKMRVTELSEALGDYWPARVAYVWSGPLSVSSELGDPFPTLSRLLAKGIGSVAGGGGGSVSGGGGGGATASGSGGGGAGVGGGTSVGVPLGGTTGQWLVKRSNDDFDLTWGDAPAPPAGGGLGVVRRQTASSGDAYAHSDDGFVLCDASGGTIGFHFALAPGASPQDYADGQEVLIVRTDDTSGTYVQVHSYANGGLRVPGDSDTATVNLHRAGCGVRCRFDATANVWWVVAFCGHVTAEGDTSGIEVVLSGGGTYTGSG